MELTELRYFYNVAMARSFSRGAALSHVSPPAVSKAVKKLEEELGVALFVRTTRKVSLSDAGEVLVEHCRRLFRRIEEMRRDLDEIDTAIRGELRIAASEVFSAFLLPSALSRVAKAHPQLVPRCFQLVPEEIAHGLVEGNLDLGFTASRRVRTRGASLGGENLDGVDAHLIAESPGLLVCGQAHPLFDAGPLDPVELRQHAWVVPRHWQREYLTSLDQFPEHAGPRRVGATTDRLSLAISLVVEGAYLGYFPQVAIGCQLRHDELRVLEGAPEGRPFRLEALTRSGTRPRASALLVIEEIRRSVLETGGDPCGWNPDLTES